ncbi:MAG: DUF1566 domain-containing protein [Pseudomonadota bacterium]
MNTVKIPAVGQHWPEQGGFRIGSMRGIDGQPDYELILSPSEVHEGLGNVAWGKYGQKVVNADHENDGLANTLALVAAGNETAIAIQTLASEGHQDLYWPSRAELAVIRANAPELLDKGWYWSSTQYGSGTAWYQSFDDGSSDINSKGSTLRVCAVRRFIIPSTI